MGRDLYNKRSILAKPGWHQRYLNPSHPMNRDLMWWYLFNEAANYDTANLCPRGPHMAWDKTGRRAPIVYSSRDYYPWTIMEGRELCLQTGSSKSWTLPAMTGINDFTIIYSGYHNDPSSGYHCDLGYGAGGAGGTYVWLYGYHASFGSAYWCTRMAGGTEINIAHSWTVGQKVVGACVRSGTTLTLYKNAASIASGASGAGAVDLTPCYIGDNDSGQWGNAQVISIQFYSRALPAAELLLHQIMPYGTHDSPRLFGNPYRSRYALVTHRYDFMPMFSRILAMQK